MRFSLLLVSSLMIGCGSGATTAPPAKATTEPAAVPSTFTPTSFTVQVSGAGRPIIFIPGLACDGHVWDDTVAHLGGKVQSHVLSLKGFAGNPPIAQPLLPTVHDEIIRYIRENHLDHPIVVGHSLGGFMTYWIAETASDAIGGAVAVDGAPFLPALMDPKATVESSADGAKAMHDQMAASPETFRANVEGYMKMMIGDPAKHQDVIDASMKSDPATSADAMYFLMKTDLRPDLGKITVPFLTITEDGGGRESPDEISKVWEAQLAAIPSHEVKVIEHSKHFVMLDQPDAFYAALDAYLASH
jgi:N-formylmaleamate deformylase